ncbi:hypothetical protein ACFXCO_14375, partial [Streptomyces hygroscopicus]
AAPPTPPSESPEMLSPRRRAPGSAGPPALRGRAPALAPHPVRGRAALRGARDGARARPVPVSSGAPGAVGRVPPV